MGGTNPYIEKADVELPSKPYTVTFIFRTRPKRRSRSSRTRFPYGPTGLPGSILISPWETTSIWSMSAEGLCLLPVTSWSKGAGDV